jgi:2-(1,2-epoxy-1,2-dihydrophenyl)acetyl-CoA isomerase
MEKMSYSNKALLNCELNGHSLWLTLNNPATSNSITYEMIDSLVSTLKQAEADSLVRCVVITGEGKNFCSGGDLNRMINNEEMFAGESDELRRRYEQGIQQISKSMEAFSKPLIAMVNGAAAGAGCDMACMCDIRIGTSETKFLESFVKIGLVPGDGGTFFLQRIVGYAKAMEMTLTGRSVLASEALQMGLLNRVVELAELKAEVQKIADSICALPPIAVQLSKKAMKVSYRQDLNTSLDLLASYQAITQRSSDHVEALNALNQKRNPVFKNK